MSSRAASAWLGIGLVVAGAAVLAPRGAALIRPAEASELLRLSGPLRGLPLPFLWRAWSQAEGRNAVRRAIGIGEWLARWLPERVDLFLYFAWRHAYNLGHAAKSAEAKARHLVDAIVLIEKARARHGSSDEPALMAAFVLMDRSSQEGEAFSRAFEQLYGESPIELAGRYLATTRVGVAQQTDELGQVLARLLLERRKLDLAAELLRRLVAGKHDDRDPGRLRRIAELVDFLDLARAGKAEFPGDLGPELRAWLINDRLFGRNPGLWR